MTEDRLKEILIEVWNSGYNCAHAINNQPSYYHKRITRNKNRKDRNSLFEKIIKDMKNNDKLLKH